MCSLLCLYVDAHCRDFVLNPHNRRRLLADCDKFDWPKEWPNSKGINAFTATANVQRKPMPLEHFLEHKMAKLAGLNKTEVCRLFGGVTICRRHSGQSKKAPKSGGKASNFGCVFFSSFAGVDLDFS